MAEKSEPMPVLLCGQHAQIAASVVAGLLPKYEGMSPSYNISHFSKLLPGFPLLRSFMLIPIHLPTRHLKPVSSRPMFPASPYLSAR